MWVRSQGGKVVVKAESFNYTEGNGKYWISINDHYYVGEFSTEEKAKDVIDLAWRLISEGQKYMQIIDDETK